MNYRLLSMLFIPACLAFTGLSFTGVTSSSRAFAGQDAAQCVADAFQVISVTDAIKLGTHLQLRSLSGNIEDAIFLGYQEKAQQYLFLLEKNGAIEVVPHARLASGNRTYQKILEIPEQQGPTCAVHSAKSCLTLLNQLGILPDSNLKTLLASDPDALFQLLKNHVSAEAWEDDYQKAFPGRQPSLFTQSTADAWISRFHELGFTQADKRVRLLGSEGINATITHDANQVEDHLEKGLPVILDTPVGYNTQLPVQGGQLSTTGPAHPPFRFFPVTPDDPKYVGWHSVLAVGIIEPKGTVGKKVVVVDSAFGEVNLWDLADVEKAIQGDYTMAASLIEPQPVAP